MNTFFKYGTLFSILAIALCGCKKNENKINFPIPFYAEQTTVVSDTKVYVKGGLLTDLKKTQELIWTYGRNFKLEQETKIATEPFLNFISKDSVDFFNTLSPYVISRNGDMLTMTATIQSLEAAPILQNQLYHHVAKYQIRKNDGNIELSRNVRIAYGSGYSEYKIPMFAYVTYSWINNPDTRLIRRGGLIINEFNDDVINRIGDRDTIVVKRYMLTVKAR